MSVKNSSDATLLKNTKKQQKEDEESRVPRHRVGRRDSSTSSLHDVGRIQPTDFLQPLPSADYSISDVVTTKTRRGRRVGSSRGLAPVDYIEEDSQYIAESDYDAEDYLPRTRRRISSNRLDEDSDQDIEGVVKRIRRPRKTLEEITTLKQVPKKNYPAKARNDTTKTTTPMDAMIVNLRRDAGSKWARSRRVVPVSMELHDVDEEEEKSNTKSKSMEDAEQDALDMFLGGDEEDGNNVDDSRAGQNSNTILQVLLDDRTGRPTERLLLERKLKEQHKLSRCSVTERVMMSEQDILKATGQNVSSTSNGAPTSFRQSLLDGTYIPGGSVLEAKPSVSTPPTAPQPQPRGGLPQLTINKDGQIVIDENSLVISATEDEPMYYATHTHKEVITSRSFTKNEKNAKWSNNESRLFYQLLGKYGTDFGFLEPYFPTKTRAHIVSRYKKDNRNLPHLIELALQNQMPIDETEFNKVTEYYKKVKDIKPNEALKLDVEALQAHSEDAETAQKMQEKIDKEGKKPANNKRSSEYIPVLDKIANDQADFARAFENVGGTKTDQKNKPSTEDEEFVNLFEFL